MKNFWEKHKKIINFTALSSLFITFAMVCYLGVLPILISNPQTIKFIENIVEKNLKVDLVIEKPVLKTFLSPKISFAVEEISLIQKDKKLLLIKNLDTDFSFEQIFKKKIVINKIGLDDFYADLDSLIALNPPPENPKQKQNKPSTWTVDWLDSLFYIKNCFVSYSIDPSTKIKIKGQNMEITDSREPKFVRCNINIDILKNNKKIALSFVNKNDIFIKNHKLFIDNGILKINDSKVFINAVSDPNANFELSVYSNKFDIKDAVELLETNLVIPNGTEILSYFKDIEGSFNFGITITNNDINGKIKLNKSSLKVIHLSNLPIIAEKGNIEITKDKIYLKDFDGWYGTSKNNKVELFGDIKDYTKSVDTNIEITGLATNDLFQNYISKTVGCPLTLTGDSKAKIYVKSKYNKIDIIAQGKIAQGNDILVDGASLSPVDYDRAFMGEFHIDGNILNIKSIKYYIAKELTKETTNVKPILTLDGEIDMVTLVVNKFGFDIPNPLPSEFLNVLIGQKLFKNGEIFGHLYYLDNNKNPKLNGTLTMNKVLIPSQRMSIRNASFKTSNNSIHLNALGRFKKSQYKFNGDIKNSLLFPIVVKNINLNIDNIDVDKILTSMNNQNTQSQNTSQTLVNANKSFEEFENEDLNNDENDELYTFDTGLLIVEKCVLEVVKGFYKEIKFGNILANLTLNKDGILEVKSNKFDFAEGISSLKVLCDLKNHKYNIKLGVKDINSDQIATTLLALPKEISGKAKGFIELNTDDSLKLNGNIKFDIQNGTIQKVGLVQYALNFATLFRNPMAMISPSTIIDLVNIPDGNFDKINGDLQIKENVVEKIVIKSIAPQLSSFIIGKYNIETKDATLRIYTKFSNKNKGLTGFLRNLSLNSLANKVQLGNNTESSYYAAELAMIPPIEADEKDCQVFLTKVDGDVENFNFLSSLKKIK